MATQPPAPDGTTRRRVAVIGGGPGGAHCARCLAESGFEVTLFEPRTDFEKACGGGIPARGLLRYPFLDDPRLPVKVVRRCLLVSPSGREADVPLRDPLYIYSRSDLHTFLLRRAVEAGATLVRARVVSFEREGAPAEARPRRGGWLLRAGDLHGPYEFLVAADGAAGSARRRLASAIPSRGLTQGIGYFMPGLSEERITLKFYHHLNGYLWVFPRPDHSSAGICAGLGERPAAGLKRLMDEFLVERYGGDLVARSEPYAALIPGAPSEPAAGVLQGEGWALVGDSGRSVDPLTREGIYYAMLAGETLAGCLTDGEPERYARTWARGPGREFAWAARHSRPFFETRFIERLVALCGRSPAVARVMSDVMAGTQAYRTLTLRLVLNGPAIARDLAVRFTPSRGSRGTGR